MKRRIFLNLFFVCVLATSLSAQQPRMSASTPDIEHLRAHVTYLASDKLEGRKTGTPGAELAAQYIAEEFKRYGLRPGGDTVNVRISKEKISGSMGVYIQTFPYVASVELGKSNAMSFASRASETAANARPISLDLRVGEDWMPLGWSTSARIENVPVSFVGYGIKAGDLKYDDYAKTEVQGRIAIAFAGTPDGDNPHGQFVRYAELRLKAAAARAAGAKGLAIIASEENFKEGKLSRLSYDNGAGGDAGLPVVVVSRQAAAQILGLNSSAQLSEVEKKVRGQISSAHAAAKNDASHDDGDTSAKTPLQNVMLTISTDIVRREAPASNVVGILEGTDPQLKNEAIVIGAHYDHLGRGGHGSLAAREGDIHHGADDNASGMAALLELARVFAREPAKPRRTIVFIAFGGEEEGLLGSNFYVNNPTVPLARTVAMINMDMIGRLRDDKLFIGGVGTAPEWKPWIEGANTEASTLAVAGLDASRSLQRYARAANAGGQVITTTTTTNAISRRRFALTLNEDGFGPSDHSSFYAKKTPVLFFFTGTHADYHKPSDTAEKINYEGAARIASFVHQIVLDLQASDRRPTYAVARNSEGMGRATGFRVYLGTVPNYAETTDGMKLDAVRNDSPAAKAGLRAGDVIVKMAGREIRNVYDYTHALSEMKAEQEYDLEVLREGQRLKLKIIPAARK